MFDQHFIEENENFERKKNLFSGRFGFGIGFLS